MIRRLDRYITKELLVPLVTGTLVVAALFAANELIAVFMQLKVTNLPWPSVVQLVLLRMPRWLILTLPVGMAIGSALSVGRLARESEVTALRAAGVPLRRILVPIVVWGAIVAAANLYVAEVLQPRTAVAYRRLAGEAMLLSAQPNFKPNTTLPLGRYTAVLGGITRRQDGRLDLNDVFLFERISPEEMYIYQAKTGSYANGKWTFPSTLIRWVRGASLVLIKSKDVVVNEPIDISQLFMPPETEAMTAREILSAIQQRIRLGGSPVDLIIDYQVRFSIPASCIIFAAASAIIALRLARSGPFVGLMVSLVMVALYYNVHVIATSILGKQGYLPPVWSAWLPNILYLLVALVAYWKLE